MAAKPLVLEADEFALLKKLLRAFGGDAPLADEDMAEFWPRFTEMVAVATNDLGPVVGVDGRVRAHYRAPGDA